MVVAAEPRAWFLYEDFIHMYIPAQQHCYTVIPEQVITSYPAEYSDRRMPAVCVRPMFPVPAPVGSVVNTKPLLATLLFKNSYSNHQRGSENMNNVNADILTPLPILQTK